MYDRSKLESNYNFAKDVYQKILLSSKGLGGLRSALKRHSKDYSRAISLLREMINNAPDFVDALILLAKFRLSFEKYPFLEHTLFIEQLEKVNLLKPDNLELIEILGQFYQKEYELEKSNAIYQKATTLLKKAHEKNPSHNKIKRLLVDMFLKGFSDDRAISEEDTKIIENSVKKDWSEELYSTTLGKKYLKTLYTLGDIYFKNEDYISALRIYRRRNRWLDMGQCYIKLNNNLKAIEMYEDHGYKHEKILFDLYKKVGFNIDNEEDVLNFKKIRKKNVAEAEILHKKGKELLKQGKIDEAINYFNEAIILNPIKIDSKLFLALIELKRDKSETAKKKIDTLKNENAGDISFWSISGEAYDLFGDYEKAVANYSKYFELKPKDDIMKSKYAVALSKVNRFDEAISILDNLIKTNPQNLNFRETLGLIYCKANKYENALETFIEALDRNKQANYIIMNIVDVLNHLKNYKIAKAYLQVVLRRDPDHEQAKEQLKLIQEKI